MKQNSGTIGVFFRLLGYLRPYLLVFLGCLGLVALMSALELLKPWPLKLAVDQVIGKEALIIMGWEVPFMALSLAWQLGIVLILLLLSHILVGFLQVLNNYITIRIGQDMVQDLRCELFDHLQRQSILFHQKKPAGDLIYRLLGDTFAVQTLLMNGVFTTLTSLALLIGMAVIMFRMDVELTLYSLAVTPFLLMTIFYMSKKIGNISMETHNTESRVYSTLEQIFSAIPLIQAFAREDDERRRFVDQSQVSFVWKLKLFAAQTVYGWFVAGVTAVGTAVVLYVGVMHVLEGALTTGELLVFIAYLASLYTPLNNLSNTIAGWGASLSRAKRVFDVMDEDMAVKEAPDAVPLLAGEESGASLLAEASEDDEAAISRDIELTREVRFEEVSFAYEPNRPVLEEISFLAKGGSLIAVVGHTGAGKTSLISLLLRFFDPQKGRILIGGQDLKKVTLRSLREKIGVVLQETQLFPISVRDNIAYGRKNASLEEIVYASKLANAHEFIKDLPEGYDTVLGERGSTLSGGQRQRISIARAILKNAPILVLDEPTSALDAETESQIMEGLDRLMHNRTTFVIAHRLSMMRRADMILVLKDHHLVESGSFAELLKKNGEFARLYAIQFGSGTEQEDLG